MLHTRWSRCAVQAGQGSVHSYAPTVEDSGIEQLTIEFSSPGPYGPHASDRGFNAIFMLAAANVWVQQVRAPGAASSPTLTCHSKAPMGSPHCRGPVARCCPARVTAPRSVDLLQVTVLNADNAILLHRVDHATLEGKAVRCHNEGATAETSACVMSSLVNSQPRVNCS